MDPPVAGISRYIQYWATQVLSLVDVLRKPRFKYHRWFLEIMCGHWCLEMPRHMLSSKEKLVVLLRYATYYNYIGKLTTHIQAGLEDSKAEIKADLELSLEGRGKGVVVGQWKEVLRSMAATVIRADPSCVVVKMENGEVHMDCIFPLLINQAQHKIISQLICSHFVQLGGPADLGGL